MDTDAAGIYHWSTAFRLAEAAEQALHTALGTADRIFGNTPRVAVASEFQRTLRFNDVVDVHLVVAAVGRSSVRYEMRITGEEGVAVTGRFTSVLLDHETWQSIPWPDDLRELLAGAGEQHEVAA